MPDSRAGSRGQEAEDRLALMRLIFGAAAAHAVGAAVRLGVPDRFADAERTTDEVAAECGADPDALLRLVRALAGLGLMRETRPGRFALTSTGQLLRQDAADSFAGLARLFTEPLLGRSFAWLAESVRTGDPAFQQVFDVPFFAYLEQRPELSARFNAAMGEVTRATAAVLCEGYDFSAAHTVVDVGGGDGTLLAAVLRAHPGLNGIVYDTARGLAQAAGTMEEAGLSERFTPVVGDFFDSVPEEADVYLLKSVVHDWNDDRCRTILRTVRAALPPHGRLLLIEPVLPPAADPRAVVGYLSDLNMLVNLGGRERTAEDFAALCEATGFGPPAITPLPAPSPFSLIEAAPRAD
ncbi:methyltransferase [Streptomyces sp. ODS28]|uniref:methyltransferase n=1 Tax=Streptomyces sp. ODS28 TaxID=3136688 RepID=UPI0031F1B963